MKTIADVIKEPNIADVITQYPPDVVDDDSINKVLAKEGRPTKTYGSIKWGDVKKELRQDIDKNNELVAELAIETKRLEDGVKKLLAVVKKLSEDNKSLYIEVEKLKKTTADLPQWLDH